MSDVAPPSVVVENGGKVDLTETVFDKLGGSNDSAIHMTNPTDTFNNVTVKNAVSVGVTINTSNTFRLKNLTVENAGSYFLDAKTAGDIDNLHLVVSGTITKPLINIDGVRNFLNTPNNGNNLATQDVPANKPLIYVSGDIKTSDEAKDVLLKMKVMQIKLAQRCVFPKIRR